MIGQTVSHYRITEQLGGGGMDIVYKAEDTKLHCFVAPKFLLDGLCGDPHALERLRREAEVSLSSKYHTMSFTHDVDDHQTPHLVTISCGICSKESTTEEEDLS
jgi:serine/threonine protein kinase